MQRVHSTKHDSKPSHDISLTYLIAKSSCPLETMKKHSVEPAPVQDQNFESSSNQPKKHRKESQHTKKPGRYLLEIHRNRCTLNLRRFRELFNAQNYTQFLYELAWKQTCLQGVDCLTFLFFILMKIENIFVFLKKSLFSIKIVNISKQKCSRKTGIWNSERKGSTKNNEFQNKQNRFFCDFWFQQTKQKQNWLKNNLQFYIV